MLPVPASEMALSHMLACPAAISRNKHLRATMPSLNRDAARFIRPPREGKSLHEKMTLPLSLPFPLGNEERRSELIWLSLTRFLRNLAVCGLSVAMGRWKGLPIGGW
jgi:hypothetical protein